MCVAASPGLQHRRQLTARGAGLRSCIENGRSGEGDRDLSSCTLLPNMDPKRPGLPLRAEPARREGMSDVALCSAPQQHKQVCAVCTTAAVAACMGQVCQAGIHSLQAEPLGLSMQAVDRLPILSCSPSPAGAERRACGRPCRSLYSMSAWHCRDSSRASTGAGPRRPAEPWRCRPSAANAVH